MDYELGMRLDRIEQYTAWLYKDALSKRKPETEAPKKGALDAEIEEVDL